jgi:hypothetical protein
MTTNNTPAPVPSINAPAPDVSTRRNASHANCDHDNTKAARAKCRREMRLLATPYDALRNDVTRTDIIDAAALLNAARIESESAAS